MSEKIGPMTVGAEDRQVFLGKDFVQHESLSEATAQLVDAEIRDTVVKAHERATKILLDHRKLLDVMAMELLEKETLNIDEIFELIMKEIDDHEREFIENKYKKACDMKIDASQGTEDKEQGTDVSEEESTQSHNSQQPSQMNGDRPCEEGNNVDEEEETE
jgi:cell division protease FtsH